MDKLRPFIPDIEIWFESYGLFANPTSFQLLWRSEIKNKFRETFLTVCDLLKVVDVSTSLSQMMWEAENVPIMELSTFLEVVVQINTLGVESICEPGSATPFL